MMSKYFIINYITFIAKCLLLKQIYNSIDPLKQKVIKQQKPLKFKLLCSGAKDAGDTAQWQSTCFTCMRPSVQYPVPHKKKKKIPSSIL